MSRKLEDEFNLPSMYDDDDTPTVEETQKEIVDYEEAIGLSEKIHEALKEVRGMDEHDGEMDEIAKSAMESYLQLMDLGMNMADMPAAHVFGQAASMLKIALEAKDSKVTRKLKQIDLMIKKERLDKQKAKEGVSDDTEEIESKTLDRNELIKMLRADSDK